MAPERLFPLARKMILCGNSIILRTKFHTGPSFFSLTKQFNCTSSIYLSDVAGSTAIVSIRPDKSLRVTNTQITDRTFIKYSMQIGRNSISFSRSFFKILLSSSLLVSRRQINYSIFKAIARCSHFTGRYHT